MATTRNLLKPDQTASAATDGDRRAAGMIASGPDGGRHAGEPSAKAILAIDIGDRGQAAKINRDADAVNRKIAEDLGAAHREFPKDDMMMAPISGPIRTPSLSRRGSIRDADRRPPRRGECPTDRAAARRARRILFNLSDLSFANHAPNRPSI